MDIVTRHDVLTDRIVKLTVKADTYEEQRILAMLFDGLTHGGTLFALTRGGEPKGSFTFDNCVEDTT